MLPVSQLLRGVPIFRDLDEATLEEIRVLCQEKIYLRNEVLFLEGDAPKAYFLAKLTYPTALVVDKVQIEQQGATWLRKPNGSGPFVLG